MKTFLRAIYNKVSEHFSNELANVVEVLDEDGSRLYSAQDLHINVLNASLESASETEALLNALVEQPLLTQLKNSGFAKLPKAFLETEEAPLEGVIEGISYIMHPSFGFVVSSMELLPEITSFKIVFAEKPPLEV